MQREKSPPCLLLWCFTPEQDNYKTNVEPVHSYDAFHTRSGRHVWCERHHRNVGLQVQHLSCRCLVVVLLWCENTISHGDRCSTENYVIKGEHVYMIQ